MARRRRTSNRKYCHCHPGCGQKLARKTRLAHYRRTWATSIQPSESSAATASIAVYTQDQDLEHEACMSAEDEGFRGVGSGDEEMGARGEHEDQVGKENSLRYTRRGRITAESDVVDTAEDGTGLSLEEDSIQMGGLGNGSSLEDEFDDWAVFDEGSDDLIPQTRDEMVAELEMMLGPDYDSNMWDNSVYHIFGLGNISQCCTIRGTCFDRTRPRQHTCI